MPIDPSFYPIMGMLIPIIIVPIVLGMRHARVLSDREHAERMRAMELGRPLPGDPTGGETWDVASQSIALIATVVPGSVFFCAFLATKEVGYVPGVWAAAAVVGLGAVVCGSFLLLTRLGHKVDPATHAADPSAKAVYAEDAFDVASNRG